MNDLPLTFISRQAVPNHAHDKAYEERVQKLKDKRNQVPYESEKVQTNDIYAPMPKEGVKHDEDKIRIELVPPELMFAVGQVLTFGADKYGDRNWEKGMKWSRVFGALMRHMWCWWSGSVATTTNFAFGDLDDETGYSHLWHAGCCISFLIAYEQRGTGEDDRV